MKKAKTRKKNRTKNNIIFNTSPKTKISKLIEEYAAEYINLGNNTRERQSYLNAACTAWNISVLPEGLREQALQKNLEGYKRINPEADDYENLLHDMRLLIKKKDSMFPDLKKIIVDALIEPINETQFKINIASTDNLQDMK